VTCRFQRTAQGYAALRREADTGRTDTVDGLAREASTFYDYVVQLAFGGSEVPIEFRQQVKELMARIVEILQETIGIIEFWRSPLK
jgi:type I restriction enzyme R subunit